MPWLKMYVIAYDEDWQQEVTEEVAEKARAAGVTDNLSDEPFPNVRITSPWED